MHGLFAWGLFDGDGAYRGARAPAGEAIYDLFRLKVFLLLREAGLTTVGRSHGSQPWALANNLPPCVPAADLQAIHEACLELGRY